LSVFDKEGYLVIKKRRIIFLATFLIIAAIAVVLCVGFLTEEKKRDIDGTLVDIRIENVC